MIGLKRIVVKNKALDLLQITFRVLPKAGIFSTKVQLKNEC